VTDRALLRCSRCGRFESYAPADVGNLGDPCPWADCTGALRPATPAERAVYWSPPLLEDDDARRVREWTAGRTEVRKSELLAALGWGSWAERQRLPAIMAGLGWALGWGHEGYRFTRRTP
jgi:hypothetical protein